MNCLSVLFHCILSPLYFTVCSQEVEELQGRIQELKNFKTQAESRLPDFVNVAAEKGDLEDQLRALQKVCFWFCFSSTYSRHIGFKLKAALEVQLKGADCKKQKAFNIR